MWIKVAEAHHHLCPQQIREVGGHCCGPKCMAWRWHPHWMMDGVHAMEGYCGLAGAPLRTVLDGERQDSDYTMLVDREETVARLASMPKV